MNWQSCNPANCVQTGRLIPPMRSCARFLVALLFTGLPPLAATQFQEPTPDELKMTADPKAPGMAAVYLYLEEVTDDQMHFESLYQRIKVLS